MKSFYALRITLVALLCAFNTQAQNITTIAGGWGDHGPASTAVLANPYATAVDKWGNVYISDKGHHVVRKVDTFGVITTYAGTGGTVSGVHEENIPATNANITVAGIAVDTSGNLFIATNSGIKKVDPGGNIITHSSMLCSRGIAIDKYGNLYCPAGYEVMRINSSGAAAPFAGSTYGFDGDYGYATAAKMSTVTGVCTDKAGNVYICDLDNKRIRKVVWGSMITTIAGNGGIGCSGNGGYATLATMDGIEGISCDTMGNVYFADEWCNVRKIDTSGIITDVAAGTLNSPIGATADSRGNIYICENSSVKKVDASGAVSTFAGGGGPGDGGAAIAAQFKNPTGLCYDSLQNLYIADRTANLVRKIDPGGIITTFAGNGTPGYGGDGGPAAIAKLNAPSGLAADKNGNLFICDRGNNRVRKVSSTGVITSYAGNGTAAYGGDGGAATAASLSAPASIAFDRAGNLYIADQDNLRIRKIDTFGIITTVAGNGALGATGDFGPATAAKISKPTAVVVDSAGNLFIADRDNYRVRKVDAAGIITTYAGNGLPGTGADGDYALSSPLGNLHGLGLGRYGELLLADDNSVDRIDSNGYIWHVAGDGTNGYKGDNIPARKAAVNTGVSGDYNPTGIVADTAGNVVFADQYNARIRKIYNASISILASSYTVCPGNTASFTSTTLLAPGFDPVYHWMQNGFSVGANFPSYGAPTLNDNDSIYCYITDGVTGPVLAVSNTVGIRKLSAYLTPSVTLTINTDTVLCEGTYVTFTPNNVYGGPNPTFYWYENGAAMGSGPLFVSAPADREKVYCRMTSNQACLTSYTVNSDTITFDVVTPTDRLITIGSANGYTVCPGAKVTCRINQLHVMGATFKWSKNGVPVSADTSYSFRPANGDEIRCVTTGKLPCTGTVDSASSNTLTFTVQDMSLSFTYDKGPKVCGETPVTCTATAVNAGSDVRWAKNNIYIATGPVCTFLPGANDLVACYADFPGCGTYGSGTVQFSSIPRPQISVSYDQGPTILRGTKVTFTAIASGDYDSFQWYHNGKPVNGANTATYVTDEFGLWDSVKCVVRSSDSCSFVVSSAAALINTFHGFRVFPNPSNGNFAVSGNDENANGDEVHITVYSQDGRRIFQRDSEFKKIAFFEPMQLKELLAPGVYTVAVKYNGTEQKLLLSVVP